MRLSTFSATLFFALICCAFPSCTEKNATASSPATAESHIPRSKWKMSGPFKFEHLTLDFGTLRDTEKVTKRYRFFNATDHTVRIQKVKTKCGCTVPKLQDRVLEPGEEGELAVTFDGTHRQGEDRKVVKIHTDDAERPLAEISLKANVVARIAIEPRSVFLGQCSRGESLKEKSFRIVSRNLDLKIESVTSGDPERFPVRQGKMERGNDQGDDVVIYNFKTSFTGDYAVDRHKTILKIKTNDRDKRFKTINVVVIAGVVGPINVVPLKVQIRDLLPSKRFTRKIQLGPRAKDTRFTVQEARLIGVQEELHLALKQLPVDPKRNGWVALELTGKTPAKVDDEKGFRVKGSIYIRTDLAEQPEIIIPLGGTLTY
ncbi:MAG TPA: DUF1573 domain-containing protein [Planctomycetes bacterium]|nr:DUF1573 domain-containing protein [Planctomycetota bacterium]